MRMRKELGRGRDEKGILTVSDEEGTLMVPDEDEEGTLMVPDEDEEGTLMVPDEDEESSFLASANLFSK